MIKTSLPKSWVSAFTKIKQGFFYRLNFLRQNDTAQRSFTEKLFIFTSVWCGVIFPIIILTYLDFLQFSLGMLFVMGVFPFLVGQFTTRNISSYYNLDHFIIRQASVIVIAATCCSVPQIAKSNLWGTALNPWAFAVACFVAALRGNLWFDSCSLRSDKIVLPLPANLMGPNLFAFDLSRNLELLAIYGIIAASFTMDLGPFVRIVEIIAVAVLVNLIKITIPTNIQEDKILRWLLVWLLPSVFVSYYLFAYLLYNILL